MKKYLNLPLAYHGALFLAMLILQLMENNVLSIVVLLDLCGVIISPVLMAVISIANAIMHEEKVSVMFLPSIIRLGIIGIVRIAFYAVFASSTIVFAAGCAVVAIAVFCLWHSIFIFTDNMMKKRPKRNRKYRK